MSQTLVEVRPGTGDADVEPRLAAAIGTAECHPWGESLVGRSLEVTYQGAMEGGAATRRVASPMVASYWWRRVFVRLASFAPERLRGVRFPDLIALDQASAVQQEIEQALSSGEARSVSMALLVNGGRELKVCVSAW